MTDIIEVPREKLVADLNLIIAKSENQHNIPLLLQNVRSVSQVLHDIANYMDFHKLASKEIHEALVEIKKDLMPHVDVGQ